MADAETEAAVDVSKTFAQKLGDVGQHAKGAISRRVTNANEAIKSEGLFKAFGNGMQHAWQKNPLGVLAGAGLTVGAAYVATTAVSNRRHTRALELARARSASRGLE